MMVEELKKAERWGFSFKFHQDIEGICECITASGADEIYFWREH